MGSISYKIEGMNELKAQLKEYSGKLVSGTVKAIRITGDKIASTARADCRVSSIANTIRSGQIENGAEVTTQGSQSAYLEFGTGNFAAALVPNLPQDWQDMAMDFYVNGLGRTAAQPYLYPAYRQKTATLEKEIKDQIG